MTESKVYLKNPSFIMNSMSDVLRDFTDNELKVFKCFVNPKYPSAIRSLGAVVKETGLDETEVLKIYATYDNILFSSVEDSKWCFNVAFFAKKFSNKYPDIFDRFIVTHTPCGVIIVPKNISPSSWAKILHSIKEQMDQTDPGFGHLLESLVHMTGLIQGNSEKSPAIPGLSLSPEIISFSA